MVFGEWLLSLSIMFLKFIHVTACTNTSFFFIASNIQVNSIFPNSARLWGFQQPLVFLNIIIFYCFPEQTVLAGYLHSTQGVTWHVLGTLHAEDLRMGVRSCFLLEPGGWAGNSHLTWTESFHLDPGWKQSSQGRTTLAHSARTVGRKRAPLCSRRDPPAEHGAPSNASPKFLKF